MTPPWLGTLKFHPAKDLAIAALLVDSRDNNRLHLSTKLSNTKTNDIPSH